MPLILNVAKGMIIIVNSLSEHTREDFQHSVFTLFYANASDDALAMAKYMRNHFAFLGIKKPQRNFLQKDFIQQLKKQAHLDWDFVFKCWQLAEREFQYLALDYLLAAENKLQVSDIEQIHYLIVHKSWWDSVDILAARPLGYLCLKFPDLIEKYILPWASSDNFWLRRSAILFQLRYKKLSNPEILAKVIQENTGSEEFFINKAIGWALREYSKTNPLWVKNFLEQQALSTLSQREASKYLKKLMLANN